MSIGIGIKKRDVLEEECGEEFDEWKYGDEALPGEECECVETKGGVGFSRGSDLEEFSFGHVADVRTAR